MATKTKQKGTIERVVESAAEAAEEIGQAAVAFRDSWEHVRRARVKAEPATRVAKRATKAVTRTAKAATRKVMGKKVKASAKKRTTTRAAKKRR